MSEKGNDPAWPPGTARIELLKGGGEHEIVLHPRPTHSPNDPLNWPLWRKHLNFGLANFYALMVFVNVDATTPTWGPMGRELNFSDATLNDTYAIGCATLAIGGPMLIPFALKYGLRPVYVLSSVGQFAVMIWAARTMTAGDWWGVNAVQCWLGALAEVLVQMTVADVYFVHQRGLANSIYIFLGNTGSSLGPVVAGFETTALGWRWVWWIIAIFFGFQFIIMFFGFEESKFNSDEKIEGRVISAAEKDDEPVIVAGKKGSNDKSDITVANDLEVHDSEQLDHRRASTVVQIDTSIKRKTYRERLRIFTPSPGRPIDFLRHVWQPLFILCTIPGVAYCSLVYAVLQAWSTAQSAALSTYMIKPPYSFGAQGIGLMNLAPFIGNSLGTMICGPISDWLVLKLAKKNNGIYEPEMRFWVFLPFVPFQIAGAWWFGYALQYGESWPTVAVAWAMANFGSAPISAIALTYLTDSYNEVVGDALVGLTFTRNTLSTIFVFALVPWVNAVGISNVFNTIGAIGLVVLFFSAVFILQGKHWRYVTRERYRYFAERQFDPRPVGH